MEGLQEKEQRLYRFCAVSVRCFAIRILARELAPLCQIRANSPKYLLTMDEAFGKMNYDGIEKKNVLKWILGEVPA